MQNRTAQPPWHRRKGMGDDRHRDGERRLALQVDGEMLFIHGHPPEGLGNTLDWLGIPHGRGVTIPPTRCLTGKTGADGHMRKVAIQMTDPEGGGRTYTGS